MIQYYKRSLKDEELNKLDNFERGCWINVVDPSEEELTQLQEKFDLDRQNLLSALDENEVPRAEFDEGTVYVILKILSPNPKRDLDTFLIILSKDTIITVSKINSEVTKRIIEGKAHFITTQRLKCLLRFFFLINNAIEKSTLEIVKLVNSKKEAYNKLTEKDMGTLLKKESTLNSFVSAYFYTNMIYEKILKNLRFYEEDKELVEDLRIEANEGLNLCRSSLKTISNIRNNLEIMLSNKLNKIITLLTLFTIFISLPAAISGLYGMNVDLPLQNNPFMFYYIISFIIFIWLFFFLFFKKQKIL